MNLMLFAIPIFFLLIGIEFLISRFHQQELYRFNDAISNISCGISQQVLSVFIKSLTLGLYAYFYHLSPLRIPTTWWSYLILFLAIDGLYYWFHRYSHEINIFWGAHVVHHQSEDYNLSVALRQSAFQSLISGVFYLPLAFLGFDPISFLLINTLQTLYQFWIHTETIDKLPQWFEYVFNTPSHHRVHHGQNPEYIDKNHGGTLIIFDRIFGTFQAEKATVVYGVTKPLSTWNPIWANLDYYKDLGSTFIHTSKWSDKLRLLFEKPGWRPVEAGGPLLPPPIQRSEQIKYHTIIPNGLSVYIAIHYLLLLLGTTFFLATLSKEQNIFSLPILTTIAFILWSVASFGLSADKRRLGFWLELSRLLLFPIFLHLLYINNNFIYFKGIILLIHLISMVYFRRFKNILNH
ncbi:sterol desaturase family protein [Aureispira anguillae]|uniref:Sterol desaturase family protein n=1 Tax=Aureispira anguillae TaxID=2864201 RepID=A0A915YKV8_9BACT|nr:sterol desaturase family protein [Aureispira anguillae]BDS15092.1 sterol desaturase family protein [Aureispira anguillae]